MLTDDEILELEQLLREEEVYILKAGLKNPKEGVQNANYIYLHEAIKNQKYDSKGKLISGYRGVGLEGSSRSVKTWSGVDIIIWLCTEVEIACRINIYREVYAEFKDTLYDDFKRRLDDYGLPNPFHNAQEVKSFKIGKNKITFIGCNNIGGSHGAGCDYAFFNEVMFIPQAIFDQVEMRCRKFWWADWNPCFTDHWFFDKVLPRPDVGYLHSTFKGNRHLSHQERNKILSYEPWLPSSYTIYENREVHYNGSVVTERNQPPPHPENVRNGTASEFDWTCYGLGLRGAMKGVVFPQVTWIDKFPDWLAHTYTVDFGFTNDPSSINRYGETETDIYIEPLCYHPIPDADEMDEVLQAVGVEKYLPMTCDSADKYTGEKKGTVQMVRDLRIKGYKASKVSKVKGVVYWILSMKKKRINIVENHLVKHVRKERENYKWMEINGILINQPVDAYNHFWDSARYGHMAYNTKKELTTEWA